MDDNEGKVELDPLFVGLTRPTMIFGVSMGYAMLNILAHLSYYIINSGIMPIISLIIFHMIGYLICFREPLFVELIMTKSQKCGYSYNGLFYYGASSYDMY
jgi:type IV secretion system protein VirB3